MTNPSEEFLKRKKEEKRAQARRQVREVYASCIDAYLDSEGEIPIKGYYHNDELVKWRIDMEPEIEPLFSSKDIEKALGLRGERFRDWMVRGFVQPSLPSTGQGTIAIFTRTDVFGVALFARLVDKGLKRELASEYVKPIVRERIEDNLNYIVVKSAIKDGKPIIHCDFYQTKELPELTDIEKWEDILIMNIGDLRKKVYRALAHLA